MQIDETASRVTFDHLIRADRTLGSTEAITMPMSVQVAVAPNAEGVVAACTLSEIHSSAKAVAANLRQVFSAS